MAADNHTILFHKADIIASCLALKECPENLPSPEIVFVGRSNVGKSTLINFIGGRKNLARTSNTPGKTRRMHYYQLESKNFPTLIFVDLPGYGYAKVSKTEQQHWQKQLETYLSKREGIVKVIHLIDGRHEIQQNDRQMAEWLTHYNLPIQLAFTKWDKVKPSDRTKRLKEIASSVDCENTQELLQMVWFSDLKDNTRQKFLDDIETWLVSENE